MEDRIRSTLQKIMEKKRAHGLWLNTLAFLEYIGCRKIVKSQHVKNMNFFLLSHMVEEARHSHFFRDLAKQNNLEDTASFAEEYLLGGKSAEKYFQNLDRAIEDKLEESSFKIFLNYSYTTRAVELRALQVYAIYENLLKKNSFSFSLEGLIREEEKHLMDIEKDLKEKDPKYEERKVFFGNLEQKLFEEFWTHLEDCESSTR